jgi:hypothetical protein
VRENDPSNAVDNRVEIRRVARVYGPSKDAMTGKWKLPPLVAEK